PDRAWSISYQSTQAVLQVVPTGLVTDLQVSETAAPSPAALCQNITYTITISNPTTVIGEGQGTQATLTDTLPDGVRLVSADHAFTQAGNVLTFDLGTIDPDGSVVIHVVVL